MIKHIKIIFLEIIFIVFVSAYAVSANNKKGTVILLHGIMNKSFMMNRIEKGLVKEGYEVVNWGYPSYQNTIEEHAKSLDNVVRKIKNNETINFVGFSLGCIIIRYYLTHYKVANVKRFVMIAPPNHGSEQADYRYNWARFILGEKSFKQLRAKNKDYYINMGIPSCEIGIIAGGKGNSKGYSKVLPGDDDGAVSLESAKIDGIKDFIQLKHEHTELILRKDTVDNVVSFIETGKFIWK